MPSDQSSLVSIDTSKTESMKVPRQMKVSPNELRKESLAKEPMKVKVSSGDIRQHPMKTEATNLKSKPFKEDRQPEKDPFEYHHVEDEIDSKLPKVLILVADSVRLIRNNSVPMLQA